MGYVGIPLGLEIANNGFNVLENSLPSILKVTHRSLFDDSIEGIEHKSKPIFSVQYHPEASPGPHDSKYLFEKFYTFIERRNSECLKERI